MDGEWRMPPGTFGVGDTHGMLALPSAKVHRSSDGLNWRSLYVSSQNEGPFRGSFTGRDHLLVLFRSQTRGHENLTSRAFIGSPPGSLRIVPAGMPLEVDMLQPAETVHVYLRRSVWDEVAMDILDDDPARAQPTPGFIESEPLIFALADAALAAADSQCTDPVFPEHLSRCIASHMITSHLGLRRKRRTESGRTLSREVARAVDFIESNAERSIGLEQIAAAAYRSPSHLARTFTAEMGVPPHRYLIGVRARRAQQLLARTSKPIAEIALDCGFTHQEHLTRTFRRQFQTTPAAFRRAARG